MACEDEDHDSNDLETLRREYRSRLRVSDEPTTQDAAPNAIVRHVYFFEPCTDRKVLIGRYTSGGAYVSATTPVACADWLTTTQLAAIRAIETRLSAGDDPREISPQIRVVSHGA